MASLEQLKEEVDSLKEDLSAIKQDTSELLAAWKDAKGALKALAWIGAAARWFMAIVGAATFIYFLISGKK